ARRSYGGVPGCTRLSLSIWQSPVPRVAWHGVAVGPSLHREVAAMYLSRLRLLSLLALSALAGVVRADPDVHDTRLLTYPAVIAAHVAFVYADDLWVADLDGRNVRRLTSDV